MVRRGLPDATPAHLDPIPCMHLMLAPGDHLAEACRDLAGLARVCAEARPDWR